MESCRSIAHGAGRSARWRRPRPGATPQHGRSDLADERCALRALPPGRLERLDRRRAEVSGPKLGSDPRRTPYAPPPSAPPEGRGEIGREDGTAHRLGAVGLRHALVSRQMEALTAKQVRPAHVLAGSFWTRRSASSTSRTARLSSAWRRSAQAAKSCASPSAGGKTIGLTCFSCAAGPPRHPTCRRPRLPRRLNASGPCVQRHGLAGLPLGFCGSGRPEHRCPGGPPSAAGSSSAGGGSSFGLGGFLCSTGVTSMSSTARGRGLGCAAPERPRRARRA